MYGAWGLQYHFSVNQWQADFSSAKRAMTHYPGITEKVTMTNSTL